MLQRCQLLNEVEARGVRLTAQRRALIETVQDATSHLDAASLLELARRRDPKIDRATAYRTIELLKRLGMIDELDLMHLNGEKHYYEVKTRKTICIWPVLTAGRSRSLSASPSSG